MKALLAMVFAGTTMSGAELVAQDRLPVQIGQRIRVMSPEVNGVFALGGMVQDTLLLESRARDQATGLNMVHVQRVAIGDIQRLEVSRGGRSRGDGAKRGAFAGFAAGVLIGVAVAETGAAMFADFGAQADYAAVVLYLGLPAGAIGALVGAATSGERWQSVYLPDRTTVSSDGLPE